MSTTTAAAGPAREQWSGQVGFLLAAIGSAIGLGNIWRFPGVAYTNGGGAFIVPYVVALVAVGIPVLFLDYAIGHRLRGSAPAAFRRLSRRFEWLGWWQVFICFVIQTYYAVIVAWSLSYFFFSFTVAWGDDAASFFEKYIGINSLNSDGGIVFSASPVWNVVIPLVIVWAFGIITIGLGVSKGVERANKLFLPLLVVMFSILVVRALTLPGAAAGLDALFAPQWDKLSDHRVWMAAFGQIFFSLSVAFGIMLTYASYLKKRSNLVGTGLVAGFANSSFEILAGIGVFATLGFMAHTQNVGVAELEGIAGPTLSFITFPTVIAQMPGGPIFGVLFFGSFAMAGLTSFISITQVVAAGIGEKFKLKPAKASVMVSLPSAVLSLLLFSTASGMYSLDIVDAFINNIGVVGSAIIMCVGIGIVLRRSGKLRRHLNAVSEVRFIGRWWQVLIVGCIPALLAFMFVQTAWSYVKDGYGYNLSSELPLGWGLLGLGAVVTVVLTVIPWRTPVDDFVPLDLDEHEEVK